MRKLGRILAAVLVATGIGVVAADWPPAVDITGLPDYEVGPRAARDSADHLHLVWFGGAPTSGDWRVFYQTYDGHNWSEPVPISGRGAFTPDIAVDGQNALHVVWHAPANPEEIYYRRAENGVWGPIANVSNSPGRSLEARVAVDATGRNLLVTWHESDQSSGNYDILARKLTAGSWGPVENVSSDSTLSRNADVAVDSAGNFHVAWEDTDTKRLYYRRRRADGLWEPKIALDTTAGRSYGAAVTVSPSDVVHVCWHDDNNGDWDIHCRSLSGGSWSPDTNVSQNPGVTDAEVSIATDADGQLYAAWHDYNNIYFAHQKNGAWRPAHRLASGVNQRSPYVVVTGGPRVHVLWQSRATGSWDVLWTTQDYPDRIPPRRVADFAAYSTSGQVRLSWTNPSDEDFIGTVIRAKVGAYPVGPADGTLVADRRGAPGSPDGFIHAGLTNGVTYMYRAFAYDAEPNFAAPADLTATPVPPPKANLL